MKFYILPIVALLLLFGLKVEAGVEDAKTLCIENVSGEVVTFPLIESPKMTFKGLYVIVQASESKILKFKDLTKAYFTDEETAVKDAAASAEEVATLSNTIDFSNFAPNTVIRVYTPSGMIVKQGYTDAEGRLQLSVSDLHRGTYIIKGGNTVFKYKK